MCISVYKKKTDLCFRCFRIIAVNYEARDKGVGRHMRGDDAVQKCPDLNIVRVKEHHGKADLSK